MDFYKKHKALIITLLFFGVLLLGLYNFNLSQKREVEKNMLIDLEEYMAEQKKEDPNLEQEEQRKISNTPESPQTHRAFNENQQDREENFSKQLDDILEKSSANQEKASKNTNSSQGTYDLGKASEHKENSDGDNSKDNISTQSGSMSNSSISFSLRGRSALSIPNPIYTCDNSGKIVVNITVNTQGRVTETGINKASSESQNQCLTEKALEYAANAVFSPLPGRNKQPGTITYNFKP